jgi:RND family efflux transporter MFP subunit
MYAFVRSGRTPTAFAAGAVVVVAAGLFWLLHRPPPVSSAPEDVKTDKEAIALRAGAPQWQFVKLDKVAAAAARWSDPVPARVSIDQTRDSKVGVPLAGRITGVFVELGQKVNAGDPLFSVASGDLADLLTQREKAQVDLDAARSSLERVKAVVATRALPAKEELAARQQFQQAELGVKLAEAKLASLRVTSRTRNEFQIASPRTGVVVEKNVVLDQQVAPDSTSGLVTVADLSRVWVLADLFEGDARDVKEGTQAEITSPSLPDLTLSGRVDVVSSVVDPQRHTVVVRVRLLNPERVLRPNVYARVRFAAAPVPGSVEVPASALVSNGADQYVYVQSEEGRFVRRAVVAGSARDTRVSILHGLEPGETVVVEGAVLLDNQIDLSTE